MLPARWRLLAALLVPVILTTLCAPAIAQDNYPTRPVKIIAPQAPGGGGDLVARIMADRLSVAMGQSFVVDNEAGAGGAIATQMTARAKPDGYTLMIGYVATHATNPAVKKNLGYDAVKDFTPIAMLGGTPNLLVVARAVPVNTLQEFVVYAKANPDKVDYGTSGVGTLNHLVETDDNNNCIPSGTKVLVTRPDLVDTSVSNPPLTATPGSSFTVSDTTKNNSVDVSAGASTTRYYLSLDGIDGGDKLLSGNRGVPLLTPDPTPGATNTGTRTVTIPTSTAAGSYFLLACADDTKVVIETSETNNCKASTGKVTVGP